VVLSHVVVLADGMFLDKAVHFTLVYRVPLGGVVPRGIGKARLPDFLGLERGGELDLLGQDELKSSVLENAFKEQVAQRASEDVWSGSRQSRLSWPRPASPGSPERTGGPSRDVAFDTGLLTVGPALQIHVSEALAKAVRTDPLTR
jgi:hypothetical protein